MFRAVSTYELKADPVLQYKISAKGQKTGRVEWGLWVFGQTAYFKLQPVGVKFYRFSVWSQKGFDLPDQ